VIRGLLLDLLATGERHRVEEAFTAFIGTVTRLRHLVPVVALSGIHALSEWPDT
jgi:hypothetical protein